MDGNTLLNTSGDVNIEPSQAESFVEEEECVNELRFVQQQPTISDEGEGALGGLDEPLKKYSYPELGSKRRTILLI